MGCNTSKESVQPVEGEDKTEEKNEEKVEGVTATPTPEEKEVKEEEKKEDKQEVKETTQDKDKDKDKESNKDSISKPASSHTLASRGERLSNHLAAVTPEPPGDDEDYASVPKREGSPEGAPAEGEPLVNGDASEREQQAATRIQAVFRGHHARASMKQAQHPQEEQTQTKEQMEQEFRADDVELCKAATTIQNSFRSHLKHKQDGKEGEGSTSAKEENKEEELDIDLSDPDLNKAATKIQASFRGHKVRKETETTGTQ